MFHGKDYIGSNNIKISTHVHSTCVHVCVPTGKLWETEIAFLPKFEDDIRKKN